MLQRTAEYNFTLKEENYKYFKPPHGYIGHTLTVDNIYLTELMIRAIVEASQPNNVTELWACLGLLDVFAEFIRDLHTVAAPLLELLKKKKFVGHGETIVHERLQ